MLALFLACALVPSPDAAATAGPQPGHAVAAEAPAAAVAPLDDRYRLGPRVSHASLHLWPVIDTGRAVAAEGVIALSTAMAAGLVKVEELDESGSVPQLRVTNLGKQPVLLAAGDVVTGGKQDRVLVDNVVVAADNVPVAVAVNCVEHGRWNAKEGLGFGYGGRAEADLKRTVATERDQGRTWAKVAEVNAEKKARVSGVDAVMLEPSSGTYSASLATPAVVQAVSAYVAALDAPLGADPRTVGLVAAVGDRVVGAEVYGNPALFAEVRREALSGLAREALGDSATPTTAPTDDRAQAFLADALAARVTQSVEQGDNTTISTEGLSTKGAQLRGKDGSLYKLDVYAK